SQFRDETAENIRILNEGLIALESPGLSAGQRREHIDAIFRAMHTIKGSARLLGFEDAGRVAHVCEHILSAVREGSRELDQARAGTRQTIRVRVDRLDRLLNLTGELAVGRQTQMAHLQTLEDLESLLTQQERLLLALETELKRLRFSTSQRESLDRRVNDILN